MDDSTAITVVKLTYDGTSCICTLSELRYMLEDGETYTIKLLTKTLKKLNEMKEFSGF